MRRFSTIILFMLLALLISACVPNRLNKALENSEADPARAAAAAPTPSGRNLQPQLAQADINLGEVVTLLPPDAIPAVLPEDVPDIMVTAQQAEAGGMAPDTRVLGVSIEGDSRAYPIPFMSEHEIVNDAVGGKLIAATW